jgi:hypothetical protein
MDVGAAKNDDERERTYRFLNEELSDQNRHLMDESRGLDTKAAVVAGFAAAALSFLLANRRQTIWWLAIAGYLAALALAIGVLWPRRWASLVPAALRDELSDVAPVYVIAEVAGSRVTIFERNLGKVGTQALLWSMSIVFLALGSGLSILSTIGEKPR